VTCQVGGTSQASTSFTVASLAFLLAASLPQDAQACSCERSSDGGIKAPAAVAVFTGTVLRVERVDARGTDGVLEDRYNLVCFAVEAAEKARSCRRCASAQAWGAATAA
jgi:hypothetical protein